ncbi:MAG TPA: hypothetical protein VHJ58_18975, partial [Vicinamibacterales bacterium]|nr:hypothetical protein [Vicinamibacterales bacterium]
GKQPQLVSLRFRVDYRLARGYIRHTARIGLPGSLNQNAKAEVDAMNRCGRFPATLCERPGVRARGRHQPTTLSGSDAPGE